jgi:hypothetical protein
VVLPISCGVASTMQLLGAGFAGAAAVIWFRASLVTMPSTAPDELPIGNMGKISESFQEQSRLNVRAALCAALAAVDQAFLTFAPSCFAFS